MSSNEARPTLAERLAEHAIIQGLAEDAGCTYKWLGAAIANAVADVNGIDQRAGENPCACSMRWGSLVCSGAAGHLGSHVAYDNGAALKWKTGSADESSSAVLEAGGVSHLRNYTEIVADAWPSPESLAGIINQIVTAQAADKCLLYDMPLENRDAVAARIRLYESMLEALDEHRRTVSTDD